MKKTLIALAAVAVSSAAMAQVTVSGGVQFIYQNSTTDGVNKINGIAVNDSEIIFSASEDLGGGLKATARMGFESGGDGTDATGTQTELGLSGGFGSVRFTTSKSANYLPIDLVTNIGFSSGSITDRLTYTSPSINGASFSVTYGDGVTGAGSSPTNTSTSYSLSYAAGPLTANVGVLSVDKNTHTKTNGGNRFRVGYNFGVAAVTYGQVNTKDQDDRKDKQTSIAVSVPLGSAITANYAKVTAQQGTATKLNGTQLALSYALSKRTSLSLEMIDYETASSKKAERNRVGLNHSF